MPIFLLVPYHIRVASFSPCPSRVSESALICLRAWQSSSNLRFVVSHWGRSGGRGGFNFRYPRQKDEMLADLSLELDLGVWQRHYPIRVLDSPARVGPQGGDFLRKEHRNAPPPSPPKIPRRVFWRLSKKLKKKRMCLLSRESNSTRRGLRLETDIDKDRSPNRRLRWLLTCVPCLERSLSSSLFLYLYWYLYFMLSPGRNLAD